MGILGQDDRRAVLGVVERRLDVGLGRTALQLDHGAGRWCHWIGLRLWFGVRLWFRLGLGVGIRRRPGVVVRVARLELVGPVAEAQRLDVLHRVGAVGAA